MASNLIAPKKTVTFTITKVPKRPAQFKTIQRLMRMQPSVQRGLQKLSRRRRQQDNHARPRAGRMWTVRVPMVKLTSVEPGESFTLVITPQIMPDLQSVEQFLSAKAAS